LSEKLVLSYGIYIYDHVQAYYSISKRTSTRWKEQGTVREKSLKYEYLLLHLFLRSVLHNVVFIGGTFLCLKVQCDNVQRGAFVPQNQNVSHMHHNSVINY